MKKIREFRGPHRFLSNFYHGPVLFDGVNYPTVEHFYQAQKTLDIDDRRAIAHLDTAFQAKKAGRILEIRRDWETIKIGIMRVGLCQKFHKGALLRKLLETGDLILEEGNRWGDTFWGICDGVGDNHLGKLLMEIRSVRLGQLTVALNYLDDGKGLYLDQIVSALIANDIYRAKNLAIEALSCNAFAEMPTAEVMLNSTILAGEDTV